MTKTERKKIKYAVIKNYTGDSALARKVSSWSDARILNEYGLKIPKKAPTIKKYTPATYKRHERELKKLRSLQMAGYTPEQAKKYKRTSYERVNILKQRGYIEPVQPKRVKIPPGTGTKRSRKAWWINNAKNKTYPDEIYIAVERVNRENGYDDYADYGWAVVFYAYTENKTIKEVMMNLKPDKFSAGEIYVGVKRI